MPNVRKGAFWLGVRRGKGILVVRQDDNSWSNPAFVALTGGSIGSYSRSRGLFAGVAIEGAGVTMDRKANAAFYASANMTPEKIFVSSPNIAPDIANKFVQLLAAQTSRLPISPGMDASGAPAEEADPNVRTFGVPDPGDMDNNDTEYDPNY